jgi:hypothetical protein
MVFCVMLLPLLLVDQLLDLFDFFHDVFELLLDFRRDMFPMALATMFAAEVFALGGVAFLFVSCVHW